MIQSNKTPFTKMGTARLMEQLDYLAIPICFYYLV